MTEKPKTVLELLTRARARIASRRHWTQGWYARTRAGDRISSESLYAVRWCSTGALWAEAAPDDLAKQAMALMPPTMVTINDTGSPATAHRKVLAAYDAAIKKAGDA